MLPIIKFMYTRINNSIFLFYFFLLVLFYLFGYFFISLHYILDINFVLVSFLICGSNFLFVSSNLKSIIVDYVNNEVSQVLLRSLLFVFLTNVIIYLILFT